MPLLDLLPMRLLLLALLGLVCLTGCRRFGEPDRRPRIDSTDTRAQDLFALAETDEELSRFVRAVEETDWDEPLREGGPYTVFAPTNAAFGRLTFAQDTLPAQPGQDDVTVRRRPALAPANQDTLRQVLAHHLVRGRLVAGAVTDSLLVSTLLNEPLRLERQADGVRVNGNSILRTIPGRNGVIHVIPAVLTLQPDTMGQGMEALLPEETQ